MVKLSILIFSKDDVSNTISLVHDIYDMADEVVLVDSSTKENSALLLKEKKDRKMDKLNIFHTIAVGYAEPLRMYGVIKCKGDWILYLDVDERMNEEFKSNIRQILDHAKCGAFAIKRYEYVTDGKPTKLFTWNIRLYRKSKVLYKGILHEQPMVDGKLEKLDGAFYILHLSKLKRREIEKEYLRILKFDRLSYAAYNDRLLDYASKLMVPEHRDIGNTLLGRFMRSSLLLYERITFKKLDGELSDFDYFMHYFSLNSAILLGQRNYLGTLKLIPVERSRLKQIKEWQKAEDGDEVFEISKIINKIGLIKFLEFDKENVIKRLNKKYDGKKQGMELLMSLLKERYEQMVHSGSEA